jgi:hypothetical protein
VRKKFLLAAAFAALFVALALPAAAIFQTTTTTASVTPGVVLNQTTTLTTGSARTISARLPANLAPVEFTSGTGASQVDLVWTDTRTYSATPTTLDLSTLAAASTNSGAATFNNIKIIAIFNNDTTNSLIVGNAASAQFTGPLSSGTTTITIPAGCGFVFYNKGANGWDAATAKNLKIDPGANNISATIAIAGED